MQDQSIVRRTLPTQARLSLMQNLNWRTLFDTLLARLNINYAVEMVQGDIVLTVQQADAPRVIEHFTQSLSDAQVFQQSLPYKQQRAHSASLGSAVKNPAQQAEPLVVPAYEPSLQYGRRVLLSLFGEEFFDEIGFDVSKIYSDTNARMEDGVMFSRPSKLKDIISAWSAVNNALVKFFLNRSVSEIRNAWHNQNTPLTPPDSDLFQKEETSKYVEGLIQQCFGVMYYEDKGEARVFCNIRRLWEFLYPPQCVQKPVVEQAEMVALHFKRDHLVSYLQQLLHGGVLFHVYRTGAAALNLRPVFLAREATIPKNHFYNFVLDRSGSMQTYFKDLNAHVLAFIKQLSELDPSAEVRIIYFDDSPHDQKPMKQFKITQLDEISAFMDGVRLGNGTHLFQCIDEELETDLKSGRSSKYNSTTIFLTDGRDQSSCAEILKLPKINGTLQKFRAQKSEPGKWFMMGFGDCDSATLVSIANTMGTPYTHLTQISDFSHIAQHIETMNAERHMMEFMYQVEAGSNTFTVPVYHNGHPTVPNVIIPMQQNKPAKITIAGDQLVITVSDSDQVPLATINDRLIEFMIRSGEIALSADAKTTKVNALDLLLREFDKVFAQQDLDPMQRSLVRDQILADRNALHRAKNDGDVAAVVSMIRYRNQWMPGQAQPQLAPAANSGSTRAAVAFY